VTHWCIFTEITVVLYSAIFCVTEIFWDVYVMFWHALLYIAHCTSMYVYCVLWIFTTAHCWSNSVSYLQFNTLHFIFLAFYNMLFLINNCYYLVLMGIFPSETGSSGLPLVFHEYRVSNYHQHPVHILSSSTEVLMEEEVALSVLLSCPNGCQYWY